MAVFDQGYASASPVLVFQPQQAPHQLSMSSSGTNFGAASPFGQPGSGLSSRSQSQPQTPSSSAGRKRSRDQTDLEDESYFASASAPEPEPEEGWIYGEGMTLIRPSGYIIDAGSQSGTWADDKVPTPTATTPTTERPNLRSFKSQRLDLTATPIIAEEVSLGNGTLVAHSPPKQPSEPTVDDFTIHLGIGWSRISGDEHIQAAARGWAKFIENHFPVTTPEIRLESKGLSSYLVEAREGWFLFGDDLKQGRLVSTSLERTFDNLRVTPPIFDGHETMAATFEAPRYETMTNGNFNELPATTHSMSQAPVVNGASNNVEVEMDMS